MKTNTEVKKINSGDTLMARSACDSECIFTATVIERKKSFVTVKSQGSIARVKVRLDHLGNEFCYALGQYSMAPMFRNVIINK